MLILSFIATYLLWQSCAAIVNPIQTFSNGATVRISVANLTEGDSVEQLISLQPFSTIKVSVVDVPAKSYFILLQAHTYFQPVVLSYTMKPTLSEMVNGTNVGLWQLVNKAETDFYLKSNETSEATTILLGVQTYGNSAPIPGGCTMEEPVEVAPYLISSQNNAMISIKFSQAASPISVLTYMGLSEKESCYPLKMEDHYLYRVYVSEGDLSPSTYFAALRSMMTLDRIEKAAHLVSYKGGSHPLNRLFALYPSTGSAYVVVAKAEKGVSVYVPTFSYGCNATDPNNSCNPLQSTFSKILCATVFFCGMFACFAAHRYFLIEISLFGLFLGGIGFYILSVNLIASVVSGVVVAVLVLLIWWFSAMPLFAIFLATTSLGFVVAGVLFVALIDLIDVMSSDVIFWGLYFIVIFSIPAGTAFLAQKCNILAASILGGYATIIPIDYYLGSNLKYIIINTIRRASVPGFNWAVIDIPIQTFDIILMLLWATLATIGFFAQSYLVRRHPPFPGPRIRREVLSETSPLLHSNVMANK